MVYGGKVYETEGSQPIAVHEAADVRPLSPIPHAPSLRIFRNDLQRPVSFGSEDPRYFYGNPGCLGGPSQIVTPPETVVEMGVLPMVAAILVTDCYRIDLEDADDVILGYTLLNLVVAKGLERIEQEVGIVGRSHDLGGVIGPAITTPDELEAELHSEERGRRHSLSATLRVNGVERERGSTLDFPFTFAEAIASASQTCPLRTGDIIAMGPVVQIGDEPVTLDAGDEVTIAVEKLGALSLKLSHLP